MPPKSNTEMIQDLTRDVSDLRSQVAVLKGEIGLESPVIFLQRVATLEAQVAELTKSRDESSRRLAQFLFLTVGAMFTVVVQLLIKSLGK